MNIQFIIICISIAILMLSIICILQDTKKDNNIEQTMNNRPKLDYENDIMFLNILIKETVAQEKILLDLMQIDYLNNNELKEFAVKTAFTIKSRLSPKYIDHMHFYFSESGFNDYINQLILQLSLDVVHTIIQKNK